MSPEGSCASSVPKERSHNEIAQDIVDLCPEVKALVEEWFAVTTATDARKHEAFRDLYNAARSQALVSPPESSRWYKAMGVAKQVLA